MRRIVYGSILVAGIVFAILEETIASNTALANTILVATAYIVGLLHLFLEWRYYREHNALLASMQFLFIPIILLLLGNFLAPIGIEQELVYITLNLFGGITAQSSLVSIVLIIPIIFIFRLTARYYDGRYPAFVIRRRQFGRLLFPLLLHFVSVASLIGLSILTGYIDVFGILFVILTPVQLVQKLIMPKIRSRRRRRARQDDRSGFMSSILGGNRDRRRRRSSSRSLSSRPSQRGDTSSSSGSRQRPVGQPVSTTPSSGYRDIPTTSRNSSNRSRRRRSSSRSSRSSSSQSSRSTPSRPVAEIEQGIKSVSPSDRKKVKSSKVSNYFPKGKYDQTDLKCMVCYEDFNPKSKKNIVICPECKFPAHEVEFRAWLNSSERCPRCNRSVRNNRRLKKGLVAESQYAKYIRKLKRR